MFNGKLANLLTTYSGTRNDVDTTAVFTAVLGDVLTLDKNNS